MSFSLQVRELTNEIKRKMMAYNPYKGERQDKQVCALVVMQFLAGERGVRSFQVVVRFSNDDDVVEDGVVNGKRIIELEKERPTWFKKLF